MTGSIRMFVAAGLVGLPAVAAGSASLLPASVSAGEVAIADELASPELLVVKFHADWCGKCKALARPLAEARDAVAGEAVLFLTFDYTDQRTATQSEYLASVLGYESVWDTYNKQTGFALLIDPETRDVVGELKNPDASAIEAAIRERL